MEDYYKPLNQSALDEKVNKNLDAGFSLENLRRQMIREKHDLERTVLRHEAQIHTLKITIQNMDEVVAHIDDLMNKGGGVYVG